MSKRTSTFALMAIFLASGAGTAMAADLAPPPPPPPAPEIRPVASDWTGPYIGAVAGGVCMESKMNITTYAEDWTDANGNGTIDPGEWDGVSVVSNDIGSFDMNGCGVSGGIVGGFNYQLQNIVLGLEGDFVWGGNVGWHNEWQSPTYTQRDRFDVDWMASVRLRAGILMNQNTLLYATGGFGWLRGELSTNLAASNAYSNTHTGYVVGGGIEHALTENIHLRAEYLFSSYNNKTYGRYGAGRATDGLATTNEADVDFDPDQFHTFRIGLTWNFPVSSW